MFSQRWERYVLADRDRLCCIKLIPNGIRHTPISADWRDVCTIVIIAAGMVRHQRCVNGQAKAAAVCCGHCPSAPSAEKRCINPRYDGNPRKPISPRERNGRLEDSMSHHSKTSTDGRAKCLTSGDHEHVISKDT